MFKKLLSVLLLVALVGGGFSAGLASSEAQSGEEITVLAPESYRDLIEALVNSYNSDAAPTLTLIFAESAAMMDQIADADIVIYEDFRQDPPIDFECGVISRAYAVLPELGARYLASEDCGDYVAPKTLLLVEFLDFIVSPDGQQVAIDLGYLPDSVEIEDQAGVTVVVPQPVRKIVAAYGVSTYLVYALGAGDELSAASYLGVRSEITEQRMAAIDANYLEAAEAVSEIGQRAVNMEEMAALDPDLILASSRTQWLDTAAELDIPIVRFEGESPELLQDAMLMLGTVLGPNAAYRAEEFNAYYNDTLDIIVSETSDVLDPPKVYFSGTAPLIVASGEMYQTAMIEAAGGTSVSDELVGFWNDVNLEQVLVWDPDVIFVPTYGGANVEAFTESEEWSLVNAVDRGNVYQLPQFVAPWDTPGPDSILGIIWMAGILYPDQLGLSCAEQAVYFYGMFYDYSLDMEVAQELCG
ncbi:MAG: ABC transporter substrate-binding protein [Chloroflexi bacterium]|nr:ABC transporter substrate-binding protein [Chloroflexota bacterium]